jgi:hypothetical protein
LDAQAIDVHDAEYGSGDVEGDTEERANHDQEHDNQQIQMVTVAFLQINKTLLFSSIFRLKLLDFEKRRKDHSPNENFIQFIIVNKNIKTELRPRGVEPLPIAWKATMLTVTPRTPL